MLPPNTSCREVVRQVQARFRLNDRGPVDPGDSAYVQARHRLPRERLEKALAATAQAAGVRIGPATALQGRPGKIVDASTCQLPDTLENQQRYPQSSTPKVGGGFPVLKLAVLFCLNSGTVLHAVWGSLHNHDLRLFRQLWEQLKAGDILLGDRASTAPPSPRPAAGTGAANPGMICYLTSGRTWFPAALTTKNRAPSSVAPNPIRCLTGHATSSSKSRSAADIGKADPENIATLTKGHSGQSIVQCYL